MGHKVGILPSNGSDKKKVCIYKERMDREGERERVKMIKQM